MKRLRDAIIRLNLFNTHRRRPSNWDIENHHSSSEKSRWLCNRTLCNLKRSKMMFKCIILFFIGLVYATNGLKRYKYESTDLHPGNTRHWFGCDVIIECGFIVSDHPNKCWWAPTQTLYAVNEYFTDQNTCERVKCQPNLQFVRIRFVGTPLEHWTLNKWSLNTNWKFLLFVSQLAAMNGEDKYKQVALGRTMIWLKRTQNAARQSFACRLKLITDFAKTRREGKIRAMER